MCTKPTLSETAWPDLSPGIFVTCNHSADKYKVPPIITFGIVGMKCEFLLTAEIKSGGSTAYNQL